MDLIPLDRLPGQCLLSLCLLLPLLVAAEPGQPADLRAAYLACDRAATAARQPASTMADCGRWADRLLQQDFHGDLDQMLAWRRSALQADSQVQRLVQEAHAHYDDGHYAQAWSAFARAADCGHADAARVALQMWQHGPALYGQRFSAGPRQLTRWRASATAAAPMPSADCPLAAAPTPATAATGRDPSVPDASRALAGREAETAPPPPTF